MPYQHLDWESVRDPSKQQVMMHIEWLLHDIYGMSRLEATEDQGGGCNFSIALILCCVIDGLATEIWPSASRVKDQGNRFKKLIRCRLPWHDDPRWVPAGTAAKVMYLEIRNALVHEAGKDKTTSARPRGFAEPSITKWKPLPEGSWDIEHIESITEWPADWPIMWEDYAFGNRRYIVSGVALYWAVKHMAEQFITELR